MFICLFSHYYFDKFLSVSFIKSKDFLENPVAGFAKLSSSARSIISQYFNSFSVASGIEIPNSSLNLTNSSKSPSLD